MKLTKGSVIKGEFVKRQSNSATTRLVIWSSYNLVNLLSKTSQGVHWQSCYLFIQYVYSSVSLLKAWVLSILPIRLISLIMDAYNLSLFLCCHVSVLTCNQLNVSCVLFVLLFRHRHALRVIHYIVPIVEFQLFWCDCLSFSKGMGIRGLMY